jgi:EAL domain-containing protein (putative c-di-GMP-specific phosphodiesterase class I)
VFVPLAEETGLVVPMGAQVLRRAVDQLAEWQREIPGLDPDFTMAVNISARQLDDGDLVGEVLDALGHSGVRPRHLLLEITETALMADLDHGLAALAGLRAAGVRLAVDDFGTGYSSLSYLKQFPISVLKVDRTFVAGLPAEHDQAIVGAVIALADAFGQLVVAEGVETEEQAAILRRLGCPAAQGWHFHVPVEPAVMATVLAGMPRREHALRLWDDGLPNVPPPI